MAKYRKKPVVIEAIQVNGNNHGEIHNFAGGVRIDKDFVYINTLEGEMRADKSDWIIKGVNGEFYPCKPDIFEKTYEKVEEGIRSGICLMSNSKNTNKSIEIFKDIIRFRVVYTNGDYKKIAHVAFQKRSEYDPFVFDRADFDLRCPYTIQDWEFLRALSEEVLKINDVINGEKI